MGVFAVSAGVEHVGDVLIQGVADVGSVTKVVEAKKADLRSCYERRLTETNRHEGNVRIRFEIGSGGKVSSAIIASSTLADSGVELCLLKTLRGLKFRAPEHGTVIVNYPFQFTLDGRSSLAHTTASASSRLSENSVTAILQRERVRFEQCFKGVVAAHLRGTKVALSFGISERGEADGVRFDATAAVAPTLKSCMLDTLSRLKFPKPSWGEHAKVQLPFILW
jgi:TonB family protein